MKSRFEYTRAHTLKCRSCGYLVRLPNRTLPADEIVSLEESLEKAHTCNILQPAFRVAPVPALSALEKAKYVLGIVQ